MTGDDLNEQTTNNKSISKLFFAIFEACGETYDNPTKFCKNRSLDKKPGKNVLLNLAQLTGVHIYVFV